MIISKSISHYLAYSPESCDSDSRNIGREGIFEGEDIMPTYALSCKLSMSLDIIMTDILYEFKRELTVEHFIC